MSQNTDILFVISIMKGKLKMTYQEKYEELINRFIERKDLSIANIQKEAKVGFKIASAVYGEWLLYHSDVFWHSCIYEMSFMEEPPTPARIMDKFLISYYFAQKLFDRYMEEVNG